MNDDRPVLTRLLELVRKEDKHLLAVRRRLLEDDCRVTNERLTTYVFGLKMFYQTDHPVRHFA